MALKFKKKLLLAKIETTYGTDATPTGSANAIRTSNLTITPIEADTASLNLDTPYLGNELQTHYGVHVSLEFDVPLCGSGTVAIAPNYGPLMRASGFAETVTPTTGPVEYDLISSNEESVTLYCFIDGQKHAATGCRGSASFKFEKGFPLWHFKFVGLWVDPASVANPSPTWVGYTDPVVMSNANTTFSLHGATPNMLSCSLDLAVTTTYRDVVGEESVQITDRMPKGSLVIEAPAISAKNWFATVKGNTTGAMQLVHGTVAKNIVQIDCPKVQLLSPKYGEDSGITTLTFDTYPLPNTGDDDIKITIS